MMKKQIILGMLLSFIVLPAFAEEEIHINQNSMKSFSGTYQTARPKYPPLSAADEVMKNEMRAESDSKVDKAKMPMQMNAFTQNYDSSNSMMMMQNVMPNMMGY